MGQNFEKIASGVNLVPTPTSALTNPSAGDVAYDSTRNTHVMYINGNWMDIQSRSDVVSSASMTSAQFTAVIVQSSINRITGSTAGNIHGLTASSDAKTILLYNASSQSQTLKHQSGTESTAANRIISPTAGDIILPSAQTIELQYDSAQSRWIIVATISSFTNPMTTAGDLIVGGTGGAPQRLAIGADGTVLTVVTGAEVWAFITGANLASSINIPGVPTVGSSTLPIIGSTSSVAYRTISGIINTNGSIALGSGFSTSGSPATTTTITFDTPFSEVPAVTANGIGVDAIATCTIVTLDRFHAEIGVYQQSGAHTTVQFNFIALGKV